MKKILFLSFAGLLSLNSKSQSVINARNAAPGANVTVRGVVVDGPEFGTTRYVQDNTGGIAVYGATVTSLNLRDSVLVSGVTSQYNNLLEIGTPTFTLISPNAHLPAANVITPSQLSEPLEGTIVKIMNCSFGSSAGGVFPSTATNYTVTSGGQPFTVRTNTLLSGTSINSGTVNISGIVTQFCSSPSTGCTTGYQVLLRTNSDLSTTTTNTTTTGIEEIHQSNNVFVYPNPVSSNINFKLGTEEEVSTVFITTVLGNTVYASTENAGTIDVSAFANGFYSLTVVTKSGSYKTKFIITK